MEYYFDVITDEELQYFHEAAIKLDKLDFERELVRNSPVSNRLHLAYLYVRRKDLKNFSRVWDAAENDIERLRIREKIWGCLPTPTPEGWKY